MSEFWWGRKVFLSGHTGFKGSWLSLWLQQMGATVTGYSLQPPSSPNLFELADVATGMQSIQGDLLDVDRLIAAVAEQQPEIVFHLAAQPLVRRSYIAPEETYAINVMGTLHLLEAVRQTPSVKAVVVITTDKCYENHEWCWPYRESDALGGYDPYSSSKACVEILTDSYRRSFFSAVGQRTVAIATARAGNVIGGGDWAADRIVPDIVRAFSKGETLLLRNPLALRPWQHVLEPLRGYLMLAERLYEDGGAFAEAWNFGPETTEARSVKWIVERFAEGWPGASWSVDSAGQPHEAQLLQLDCSKVRTRLSWRSALTLEQGVELTRQWYQTYCRTGGSMREFTLEQIKNYSRLANWGEYVG